jgi:hypothetical protein
VGSGDDTAAEEGAAGASLAAWIEFVAAVGASSAPGAIDAAAGADSFASPDPRSEIPPIARITAAATPAQTSGFWEVFDTGSAITRPVASGSSATCTVAGFDVGAGAASLVAARFAFAPPAAAPCDFAADLPDFPDLPLLGAPFAGARDGVGACTAGDFSPVGGVASTGLRATDTDGAALPFAVSAEVPSVPAMSGSAALSDRGVSVVVGAGSVRSETEAPAVETPATSDASGVLVVAAAGSVGAPSADAGALAGGVPVPHAPSLTEKAGAAGASAAAASPDASSTSQAARNFDA